MPPDSTTAQPPSTARTEARSDVPVEALRWAATITPEQPATDGTVPLTILARTNKPISHWYWGKRCLHDFAGMESSPSVPLDWEHEEIVGVATKFTESPDGLLVNGKLTPFQPTDRASEIAHKWNKGVPYQASVDFDDRSLVVEDVADGMQATVNGQTLEGPLTIFRKWKLRAVAICKYGMDPNTNVQFSATTLSGRVASVTRFSQGTPMSTTPPPEQKPTPPTTPTENATAPAPPPGATQLSRKQQAAEFINAFGDVHGPTLFAQHDTFAEAQAAFIALVRKENETLKAQVTQLSQKTQPQGETPVSFTAGANANPQTPEASTNTKWKYLPETRRKICQGTKLPATAGATST